jgi:hypothetical protein
LAVGFEGKARILISLYLSVFVGSKSDGPEHTPGSVDPNLIGAVHYQIGG